MRHLSDGYSIRGSSRLWRQPTTFGETLAQTFVTMPSKTYVTYRV